MLLEPSFINPAREKEEMRLATDTKVVSTWKFFAAVIAFFSEGACR